LDGFQKSLFASNAKFSDTPPMLKGIHPAISPELLKILAEMGHGDEIILADAHFPAHSFNARVIRADGLGVGTLLDGILPLFELDSYADPLVMMQAVAGDQLDPAVEAQYMSVVKRHVPNAKSPTRIDRFAFYDRAKSAFAVVMTGETAKYGNLLLKKGVTPVG
jgi:L-fucose mutarotase